MPGWLAAGDLAGALLAQRTHVDGGPGVAGPPRLRDFGEGAAGAAVGNIMATIMRIQMAMNKNAPIPIVGLIA
jgi:hypothetical protein